MSKVYISSLVAALFIVFVLLKVSFDEISGFFEKQLFHVYILNNRALTAQTSHTGLSPWELRAAVSSPLQHFVYAEILQQHNINY